MSDRIFGELQKIINEIKPQAELVRDTNLPRDLEMDSLDLISFFFEVENAFGIKIPESDIEEHELVRTDKMIEYIGQKINK